MSFGLLLCIMRARKPVQKTYPPGVHAFTVPAGVIRIETLTGKGGVGQPGYYEDGYYQVDRYVRTVTTYEPGPWWSPTEDTGVQYVGYSQGPNPFNLSDHTETTENRVDGQLISTTVQYYTFSEWYSGDTYYPPTTGPSTTAFGKVFPGGLGGPASSASHQNVPVISGAQLSFTVAANGALSFTYFE